MALPFLGTPESVRLANEEAKRQEDITRQDMVETIRNTISATIPLSVTALTGFLTKDPVLAIGAGFITDAIKKSSDRRREERRVKRLETRQRRAAADLLVESGQFQNRREALAEIEKRKIQAELENAEKQKDALVEQFGLIRRQKDKEEDTEQGNGEPTPVQGKEGEPLALESTVGKIDNNISAIADLLLDRFADDELERARERERRIEESRQPREPVGQPEREQREERSALVNMLPLIGGIATLFGGLATAVGGVTSALTGFLAAGGAWALFKNALGGLKNLLPPRTPVPPGGATRAPTTTTPVPPTTGGPTKETKPGTKPPTTPTPTTTGGGGLRGAARIMSRAVPLVAAVATVANVADSVVDAGDVLDLPEGVDPTVGDRVAAGIGGLVEALTFGMVSRDTVARSIQNTEPVTEAPETFDEFSDLNDVNAPPSPTQEQLVLVKNEDGSFDIKRVVGPQRTGEQLSEVSREIVRATGGGAVVDASTRTQVDARSSSTSTSFTSAPLNPTSQETYRAHPHPLYN